MNDIYSQASTARDAEINQALQAAGGDKNNAGFQQAYAGAMDRYHRALQPILFPQYGMLEALQGNQQE